jgi:hypothetical protein
MKYACAALSLLLDRSAQNIHANGVDRFCILMRAVRARSTAIKLLFFIHDEDNLLKQKCAEKFRTILKKFYLEEW